jgi:orotate phosphoribosyltransferase
MVSDLGRVLLKIGALKLGSFETRSGAITPYYIDLRSLPSFPEAHGLAIDCLEFKLIELEKSSRFDSLCGVPLSGLVLAASLAQKTRRSLVFPLSRKEPSRGLRGYLSPGANVLVLDDVSETGLSIEAAVKTVRINGGVVRHALTLIDRLEGAKKHLSEISVTLHSFTDIKELASGLKEKMAFSEEEEKTLGTL